MVFLLDFLLDLLIHFQDLLMDFLMDLLVDLLLHLLLVSSGGHFSRKRTDRQTRIDSMVINLSCKQG